MNLDKLPGTMTPAPMVTAAQVKHYYKLHHRASVRGYISRKTPEGLVYRYDGKFGTGFVILTPRFDSKGHCWGDYYVERKGDLE